MDEQFYELLEEEVKVVEPATIPVTDMRGRITVGPDTSPTGDERRVNRRYVNEQLNSRLVAMAPSGPWRTAVTAELPRGLNPLALMCTEDRIVVQCDGRWGLFSKKGDIMASGMNGPGDIILDADGGRFFLVDENEFFAAYDLSAGRAAFVFDAIFGDSHTRTFMACRKGRFIGIGQKILVPIDSPEVQPPAPEAVMEVLDLGERVEVEDGFASNVEPVRTLLRKTPVLLVAIIGDTLTAATQDRIYVMDIELKIKRVISGLFYPLAMSLDEKGRIYLIVEANQKHEFWLLVPEGQRLVSLSLPLPRRGGFQPPIVAYNHSVYIPVEEAIIIIGPAGDIKGYYKVTEAFSGAVITGDNKLLVSDGADIVTFDNEGQRKVLCSFPSEILRTAPILTENGLMWVATDKHLYGLKPTE